MFASHTYVRCYLTSVQNTMSSRVGKFSLITWGHSSSSDKEKETWKPHYFLPLSLGSHISVSISMLKASHITSPVILIT